MKSPRTWVKKIVCALSIFAVGATTVTPAIYAQDDAKAKEEAAAIQDVQSYIAIEQTSGKNFDAKQSKMKFAGLLP